MPLKYSLHGPALIAFCLELRPLTIVERIPAKRTTTRAAALEPLEQTSAVESVPARSTPLIRNLPVRSYDTITNRTFSLALQRALYVASPGRQRID